jgi:hypothetical protein
LTHDVVPSNQRRAGGNAESRPSLVMPTESGVPVWRGTPNMYLDMDELRPDQQIVIAFPLRESLTATLIDQL